MRDPKRIKPILDRLFFVWAKYPDLRLGQLLLNVVESDPQVDIANLLYFKEDEDLLTQMEDFYHKISIKALDKVKFDG